MIIRAIAIVLAACSVVFAGHGMGPGPGLSSEQSAVCSSVPFYKEETNNYFTSPIASNTGNVKAGLAWLNDAPSSQICAFDILLQKTGDVSGYTYLVDHYSGGNGSSPGTNNGTVATISGASISNGWLRITLSTPIVLAKYDMFLFSRSDGGYGGIYCNMGTRYLSNSGSVRPAYVSVVSSTTFVNHPSNVRLYTTQ